MRASPFEKRFFRLGLLAFVAAASYWICSTPVETAKRVVGPEDRPPMFALQVGIGKYTHAPTWAELLGAVTDVVEMKKVLIDRFSVPSENIVTLTDAEGTKENIFRMYKTHLIAKAREYNQRTGNRDAVVLFQFSGHGSQVPDKNNDERDDGKDETLVTVHSQDAPGKNFDITDDEIYALTRDLRQFTDNIVYIFDSCHSGSGTRNAENVRRLPERKTVPEVVDNVGVATRSEGGTKREDASDSPMLPPGEDYIVITAARANELASQKDCFEECGDARRPVVYGNLTFYLIDELKNARADTSYRELMENVTRRVKAEKETQTPQLEGDKTRFVFGRLGKTEDNFVRITAAESKKPNGERSVKIATGAMQGVAVGTIVSFYDKGVPIFDGVEPIATGRVMAISAAESTVLLTEPKREITIADKAVVVAPDLSSLRLKVDLGVDEAKFSASEKRFVAMVRDLVAPPDVKGRHELDLVTTRAGQPARWDVALLKDKFSTIVTKIPGARTETFSCYAPTKANKNEKSSGRKPDREVFYLAGRDFIPLFGFCMETAVPDERIAAERLRNAFAHLAGLRTVNAISNKRSLLNKKITVTPVRLGGELTCQQSTMHVSAPVRSVADAKTGFHIFDPLELVWFEVANNSTKPLYVALLNVDPSGAVILMTPRGKTASEADGVVIPAGGRRILPGDDCRTENGEIVEAGAFMASRTPGIDRFKFIFSTGVIKHEHFAYLERPPLTTRRDEASLGVDWTTIETNFEVKDTGQ